MAPTIYEQGVYRKIIPDGENTSFTVQGQQITVLALPGNQLGHISKVISDDASAPVTTDTHRTGPYPIGNGSIHWEK